MSTVWSFIIRNILHYVNNNPSDGSFTIEEIFKLFLLGCVSNLKWATTLVYKTALSFIIIQVDWPFTFVSTVVTF